MLIPKIIKLQIEESLFVIFASRKEEMKKGRKEGRKEERKEGRKEGRKELKEGRKEGQISLMALLL